MSSERPKYVPAGRRRKHSQRFHGAFTGGYSAGYFNTVGSKEGWKPRQQQQRDHGVDEESLISHNNLDEKSSRKRSSNKRPLQQQQQQQRLEDFMDEEDHDQWAGPRGLKSSYKDNDDNDDNDTRFVGGSTLFSSAKAIEHCVIFSVEPRSNMGNKLLRVLGWREGNSSAYVPNGTYTKGPIDNNEDSGETLPEAKIVLSKKRLRKVQLQQKGVKIPPPKLDTSGCGFEPYKNAPEFKAYREKRKKQAQARAKLGQHTRDVYRVADVLGIEGLGDDKNNDNGNAKSGAGVRNLESTTEEHISHDTIEDFVGSKSVGGFALRDEDDDAYDDEPLSFAKGSGKVKIDNEEYSNEIYVHSSDDEEGNQQQTLNGAANDRAATSSTGTTNDLAGVLSSFAGIGSSAAAGTAVRGTTNPQSDGGVLGGGVTADGRPPLQGFALGGALTSHSIPKRYRGPDVPLSYDVKRHEFGPDENPLVLQALSRAVQLEVVDEKRQQAFDEAPNTLRTNASSNTPSQFRGQATRVATAGQPNAPMAGGAFAGLAEAMRNRFTSVVESGSDNKKPEAGLRIPMKGKDQAKKNQTPGTSNNVPEEKHQVSKEIEMKRTVLQFVPHRLLCKRFHVPVPVGSTHVMTDVTGGGRITEALYFQKEILNTAAAAGGARDKVQAQGELSEKSEGTKKKMAALANLFHDDGTMKDDAVDGSDEQKQERPPKEIYKSIFDNNPDEGDDSGSENSSQCEERGTRRSDRAELQDVAPSVQEEKMETNQTALIEYNGKEKEKKKKKRKRNRAGTDTEDEEGSASRRRRHRRHRKKRSRSVSSDSSDLSRDSTSTDHRKERKQHRDRKDRKKHRDRKDKKKHRDRKDRKQHRDRKDTRVVNR